MNRIALLIDGSHIKGVDYLPGVKKDIQNWQKFLTSPHGGGWKPSEINILQKPTKFELLSLKSTYRAYDYVLIVFSGHGWEDANIVYLVINDNYDRDRIDTSFLTAFGHRSTTIIDACRSTEDSENIQESSHLNRGVAMNSTMTHTKQACQHNYTDNSAILIAFWQQTMLHRSLGAEIMYSCSSGEAAEESSNNGGYYTTILLKNATIWASQYSRSREILTTEEAHNQAATILHTRASQTPQYAAEVVNLNFPFAVR